MIVIKYSLLINLASLFETLKDKRWLDKNGYIYNLNFWNLFRNESKKVNEIKKILSRIEIKNKTYIVYLYKYSTYGSYKIPNKIYLNIYQPFDEIEETFYHELKHLQVEGFVQKNKLSHEQKEDLVNKMIENDKN
jgi:hypothetical protein